MKIQNGFTIWARKACESEIFLEKPDHWFKVWFYIISKVSHRDNGTLNRGEGHFTYNELVSILKPKSSKAVIDRIMRWLRTDGMLTTRKTTRGLVISVVNYDTYQDIKSYVDDTKKSTQTTARRQPDDTIYNKNETLNKLSKDNMVAAPQVFGNKFVNLVLSTFKERKGVLPIDKSIRRETYALSQRITSFNKARGRDGEADFVKVLNQLFDRMEKEEAWDKIQRLEPVRLRAISWFDAAVEKEKKND